MKRRDFLTSTPAVSGGSVTGIHKSAAVLAAAAGQSTAGDMLRALMPTPAQFAACKQLSLRPNAVYAELPAVQRPARSHRALSARSHNWERLRSIVITVVDPLADISGHVIEAEFIRAEAPRTRVWVLIVTTHKSGGRNSVGPSL